MSEEKREVGRGGGTQETPLQQSWNKNEGPLWEMISAFTLKPRVLPVFSNLILITIYNIL